MLRGRVPAVVTEGPSGSLDLPRHSPLRFRTDAHLTGTRIDEGTDMLTSQRSRKIASLQPIDDLNLSHMHCAFHVFQHHTLNDEVVRVHFQQTAGCNLGNEIRVTVFFRIVAVEAVFVLHEDARPCTKKFSHKIHAGVRPVRRNSSRCWRSFPLMEGWHTDENWNAPVANVHRQLLELLETDQDAT